MRRIRMRWLIATIALLAMLATTLLALPAVRNALAASDRPQEYLALGDSVAFGYSPLVSDPTHADNFVGYPTPVAAALKENLTNASCPGEASAGFLSLTGADNGCRGWRFGLGFPLHVAYSTSQMDFADQFLQSHPQTLVVSIDIGANDLFLLQKGCLGSIPCIVTGLPGMLATLSANLDTIYGHIRNTDSYHHKIVALTYYSLNYSDPTGTGIISRVNQVVADRTVAWGGVVADGFGAFQSATVSSAGDSCVAGLLVVTSTSPLKCNIHPSAAGHALLAQAIVNALRAD